MFNSNLFFETFQFGKKIADRFIFRHETFFIFGKNRNEEMRIIKLRIKFGALIVRNNGKKRLFIQTKNLAKLIKFLERNWRQIGIKSKKSFFDNRKITFQDFDEISVESFGNFVVRKEIQNRIANGGNTKDSGIFSFNRQMFHFIKKKF